MERSPELLLEGLALAGYAVGAEHGFVLTRSEYPLSKPRSRRRPRGPARRAGSAPDIAGTDFDFDVTVIEGAGSYVVGEETALLACLQGLRGTVSARPPFPAERGALRAADRRQQRRDALQHPLRRARGAAAYRALSPGGDARARSWSASTSASPARASTRSRSACPVARALRGARRRAARRTDDQGGADRRPARRDPARARCSTPPFDFEPLAAEGCMLGHGSILAFDDRDRHARGRPPPAAFRRRRELRQVLPVPDRAAPRARDVRRR